MKYYLAYGSNLNKEQMARRCPGAKAVGTAVIEGYALVFRRGYLTIEPSRFDTVPVGIWEISDANERALDRYEGHPVFYRKQTFLLECSDGETRECMAYIMTDGYQKSVPSDGYFYTVYRGYKDFNLEVAPLIKAYQDVKWPEDDETAVF